MQLILCVDERDGLMFHQRRQSQDRAVRRNMADEVGRGVVWMTPYSYRQFTEDVEAEWVLRVDPEALRLAGPGQYCFWEGGDEVEKRMNAVERLILYRWNRHYPSDQRLEPSPTARGWRCLEACQFPGFSHDIIKKEVYVP